MAYPKKGLSIDVGNDKIKILLYQKIKDKVKAEKMLMVNTPNQCLEDGLIIDFEKMAEAISEVLKENKITEKNVIFSISSTKIITREVDLPDLPKKKLDTLINMNAEEYFPVDLSEYTIDYRVLEHFVDNEDKMVHVNMIAAFSPLTEAYAKLAEALGLKLGGIDHSGNSMMNIAKSLKREDTYLLLNLGSNSTMILIVRGEEIRFSRNLPYGTRLIINAIEDDMGVNYSEAMKLSETSDLFASGSAGVDSYNQDNLGSALEQIISGVSRLVDFYLSRNKDELSTVVIGGGGTRISGIRDKFAEYFKAETLILDSSNIVSSAEDVDQSLDVHFMNAIGAVDSALDLSPASYKQMQRSKAMRRLRMQLGVLGLVVLAGAMSIPYATMKRMEAREVELQQEIEKMKVVEELKAEAALLELELNFYEAVDNNSRSTSELVLAILEEMERVIPTEIDYLDISTNEDALIISAITNDKHTMAKFYTIVKELEVDGQLVFSDVYLPIFDAPETESLSGVSGDEDYYNFSLTCTFNTAEEVQDEQ